MTKLLQLVALVLCLLIAVPGSATVSPAVNVHAILEALPPFSKEPVPEPLEKRSVRLEPVSVSIWDASEFRPAGVSRELWAGMLVELGRAESNYALYVHSGNCVTGPVGARCDSDKHGIPRSKGIWQQQKPVCPRVWELLDGSEEQTREAARCAAQRLSGAYHRCSSRNPDPLAGAYSGYRGASCTWDKANGRAKRARMFAARLGG